MILFGFRARQSKKFSAYTEVSGEKFLRSRSRNPGGSAKMLLDLLRNAFSTPISIFRLRLCENSSTDTLYMLHYFHFGSLEIWQWTARRKWAKINFLRANQLIKPCFIKLRYEKHYAVGLISFVVHFRACLFQL